MNIPLSLPTDNGFLRRECPNCEREFKCEMNSAAESEQSAEVPKEYFCPYCGQPETGDKWWTKDQLQLVQNIGLNHVAASLNQAFADGLRGSKNVSFTPNRLPEHSPLVEPSDMTEVKSPCHPTSPIKVDEEWNGSVHCLVCGTIFLQ